MDLLMNLLEKKIDKINPCSVSAGPMDYTVPHTWLPMFLHSPVCSNSVLLECVFHGQTLVGSAAVNTHT